MIIRASLLILATVAALAVSSNGVVKASRRKRKPHLESSGDEDANRQSGHAEEKEEIETADASRQRAIARQDKNPNGVEEAEQMKHLLNDLRRREIAVENKLLELYGLREQHSFVTHLKRQLRVRSSEVDMLKAAVSTLEAEKNDLEKEIRESFLAEKQLETAEKMVKQWQEKTNAGEIQMKAQLNMIEEQVYGYHSKEKVSREPVFERKTKTMDNVKLEVLGMNRRNKELELEKRELALKLNSAQAKTTSLSTMTESEVIAGVKEEVNALKHVNKGLLKQIETLQKQRFSRVEELVYQKWLNSCLRFEIQDYRTPPRTPKSTSRATSDSADSSPTSTESREIDDTSSTLESTAGSQSSISKSERSSLITKIKRWNKSKRDIIVVDPSPEMSPGKSFWGKTGLIRGFSMSMVTEGLSKSRTSSYWNYSIDASRKKSKKDLAESPSPEIRSCLRRVSFNDSVSVRNLEPAFEDTLAPVEMEPCSHKTHDRRSSRMLTTESRDNAVKVTAKEQVQKHQDVTASEATGSSHQSANELEKNETNKQVVSKIRPARSPDAQHGQMNQIEASSPCHVSAFIIFIFILLLIPRFCSWLYFD
ncbi:protein CHUP1, chloroplastic-like [Syzygium oleosum]|uniref:protein CHUP1, chloroplastic-like n=1 Tax=Syzygium oleosum TaxID=219896 RepID=UPI0011D22F90|nr:protein CHUP1, chloroplastic-like [Syzygium oleosum]